ncbi:nitrate reductase [Neptuniibacter sp. CAU 1671]|uniref:nitrate reductase n=1 Tax=Neptuniibacter sp. CAU 1671 TaxID=3032593 RepID=UPI0023DAACF5|nr:nitrate reductase [Neptuniibacter sp. CAU 1671]MDF2180993.1 nitrate reductase [Neptuniibacter sp. CAU 1671]
MQKQTTCPYCGVGCGVDAEVNNNQVTGVKGDAGHPANFGRLCVKGSALDKVLGTDGRLLSPLIDGQAASWEDALNKVASGFLGTIKEHGPDSVAFYLSGQLLTEDYYVANKLLKGFVGTSNVDTNSRLCMSSAVAGYKRAFGTDTVPCCYEDLELANLLVLVGSNAAWNHPILFQRMKAAKQKNPDMKVVVVDPRETATCDLADLHLPIKPGSDTSLFSALLAHLARSGAIDQCWIEQCTEGFEDAVAASQAEFPDLSSAAKACDIDLSRLTQFFEWFTAEAKTVTFYSQGVNQSSSGTDNSNAIINCHLATARIGKPGAGPFSITGQPNAMGGREVGGLANQLAAHMDYSSEEMINRVGRFWNAPNMARSDGLKAVDLFEAVEAGKVKAIWIMGTNPVVSLPNADQVKRALEACPLVVVSECIANTDTLKVANVCLPATGWSEKNGTVTNSERRISRQRSLLPPSGEARHDWWIVSEVAKRMGYGEAFAYEHPAQIFAEHAALSGFENNGSRDFDISLLQNIDEKAYDNLAPVQWPVNDAAPYGTARMFADGKFFTPSGRARFIPIITRAPVQQPTAEQPLIMNTGRIRDQWHTMAITGRAPLLFQHRAEPFVELHPEDAKTYGITEGALVKVTNTLGEFIGRARVPEAGQRKGEIFVPMHWNGLFSAQARMGTLVAPVTDPVSGQPEAKHAAVKIEALQPVWEGWLMVREPLDKSLPVTYWSRVPKDNATLYYLADDTALTDGLAWCREHFGTADIWLEDKGMGSFRAAGLNGEQLEWAFFVMPYGQIPSTMWLEDMFAETDLAMDQRRYLLSVTGCELEDPGQIICSCYQVGSNAIEDAISMGCRSVEALGEKLKCGTNCGSCIPELAALLQKH